MKLGKYPGPVPMGLETNSNYQCSLVPASELLAPHRKGEAMTDFEKLTLREIDALVAEKVMGYRPVRQCVPSYTTDATDRDQVVEKMRELGFSWTAERKECSHEGSDVASVMFRGRLHEGFCRMLESTPNAIGRCTGIAALKAVSQDEVK